MSLVSDRELNNLLSRRGGRDLPVPRGFFGLNELAVMLEHEVRARMSKFQRKGSSVVKAGEVVGSEAVPQSVVRPILNFGGCTGGIEQLAVFRRRHIAR